ncbi:peptidoglycan DD-metalloendopeptidase family protein [Rubellimicrobium roseum]|uniref:LysM peptidoglycan-binding domain-containing protein n=1 Tax=Rubellimicrobium roseum TaxID=687525 RepID=A0A5C4NGH9_9RHOB|nr:peptidoglycan DD-metalloendopeptidase family protein [Rubellimicrobium roseum]TNC73763.1 LysM peptidoglycan-binding domain-containing protein [Rubellimicrobium roseum]
MSIRFHGTRRAACAALALGALSACGGPIDTDMRSLGDGFSTTDAALNAMERPAPDSRGVISYPTYQVAVARQGDTVGTLAGRLGLSAEELAAFNGLAPDAPLRAEELVALPAPVAAPGTPMAPAAPSTDLVSVASAAIDRAGPVSTTPLAPVTPAAVAPPAPTASAPAAPSTGVPSGVEPIRHPVARGETAYSIARLYGVPVRTIAEWNGLGPDLAVREGQQLLVPPVPAAAPGPNVVAAPGVGSPTPVPPSASEPLPDEEPPAPAAEPEPAPVPQDLGAQQTETASAQLVMPATGSIIRDYAPGRNEGIDIGAPAGTEVRAADAGTVAAITTNTEGIQIVVIRHANDLLTVYTHVDSLTVAKDDRVSRGQPIGAIRAGDPSFLHFEVRRGMASQDPSAFLP